MTDALAARTLRIFDTRLGILASLLEKAEAGGADLAALATARLAPDMHPFPWQVVFACNQARQFVDWCGGADHVPGDAAGYDWAACTAHVAAARAAVREAIERGAACAAPEKRIEIPPVGVYMDLPAERYVDDWLLPNFYFHIAMAYALLRANGVQVGKADYMAFLAGDLRPMT